MSFDWEIIYSTGQRSRINAPHINGAISKAWDDAPADAEGLEVYGIQRCAVSSRPTYEEAAKQAILTHGGIVT